MCRLLGWAGAEPVPVATALGDDDLAAFTALSRQHADGWGMAWWGADAARREGAPSVARSTTCAADDPRFNELATGVAADAGFAHLRWATPGLPVVTANTHPFTHGRLAFAHNGAIHPQPRLDELLPAGWRSQMGGTTDSERYFLAIAARLDGGESPVEAVAAVVHHIFGEFEPTSLNAMMLAPDALYVISAYDQARVPPLGASAGRASSSGELDTVFYDLHYRRRVASVVVASSGFSQRREDGWEPLGNMRLLRIERDTLSTSVSSLEKRPAIIGESS
ncbi:MAG: class II glutamine amidotransferase [Candidatus Dormibacteraeota bacterium]|uniref:Class II glutamine amidotransferase n=1 Tax=Candidatus Amunia macphersoniae TaxID=3127014 RepID=A0A934KD41_9BACT|nr:class II glutamine amidotransferase [Candidatus Dormibacteraeota bacterium]